MKKILIVLSLMVIVGCGNSIEDNKKPPVVTIRPDGSFHIDRLDPDESVIIPLAYSTTSEPGSLKKGGTVER